MILKMITLIACCYTTITKADVVDVYLLGGQSNMKGNGQLKNLPAKQRPKLKNVFFFADGKFEIVSSKVS